MLSRPMRVPGFQRTPLKGRESMPPNAVNQTMDDLRVISDSAGRYSDRALQLNRAGLRKRTGAAERAVSRQDECGPPHLGETAHVQESVYRIAFRPQTDFDSQRLATCSRIAQV